MTETPAESLADIAAERGIRYFLISYTDLFGAQRAKLVPAEAIAGMQRDGAGFAGFATWLDMTPADPDLFAIPDPASLVQLPWKREVGWLASDLVIGGAEVAQGPRNLLRRLVRETAAAHDGAAMKSGVECEFFLVTPDGQAIGDPADTAAKPCYDQGALLRRYDVITEICDAMLELGWGAYQNDHEDANGQFEMNWSFADALVTADRHSFFKFMVKSVAERHGLRATFMPKPFARLTGSGCHAHVSLWRAGTNLFAEPGAALGISTACRHAVGGLLEHARAICALLAPTVNSYKRLAAPPTTSGATWSPSAVTWGGNNRTHMIRIPDGGRLELRLADGAANPYLLQAGVLAAIGDGLRAATDPGPPRENNMYTRADLAADAPLLPETLLDAVRALETSTLASVLGDGFVTAYAKLKRADWVAYARHLTQWERDTTLDC